MASPDRRIWNLSKRRDFLEATGIITSVVLSGSGDSGSPQESSPQDTLEQELNWLRLYIELSVEGYTKAGIGKDFQSLSEELRDLIPSSKEILDSTPSVPRTVEGIFNLPDNYSFRHNIQIEGIFPLNSRVRTAYSLYKNKVPELNSDLAPLVLATQTTESGLGKKLYVSTGGSTTLGNARGTVTKQGEQLAALEKIASWVGEKNLLEEASRVTGWTIKNLKGVPSSSQRAIGPKQFLPTTWQQTVEQILKSWSDEQHTQFLNRLKKLEVIKEEVSSLRQFNPFNYSEAFVMGMLYMQLCKIDIRGTNFFRWNASGSQARMVVSRYQIIKAGLDELFNRYGKREVVSAKEIVMPEPFGPIYQGPFKVREISGPAYGVHGLIDYSKDPNTYQLLWFGVDCQGIGEKTIISPINGRVINRGSTVGGEFVDLQTHLRTNEGKLLACVVRFHHIIPEGELRVNSEVKMGQPIGQESPEKEHVHVGCIVQYPGETNRWLFAPIFVFMSPGGKATNTYSVPQDKSVVLSDSYIERGLEELVKVGILRRKGEGAKTEVSLDKEAERKAKEALVFGIYGKTIGEMRSTPVFELCQGIVLMNYNFSSVEQITRLVRELKGMGKTVYANHEGGKILGIPDGSPSPRDMKTPERALYWGRTHGRLLNSIGVDINLAPVADIFDPRGNEVIGDRSFGDDPQFVAGMVAAYVKGLQEFGVRAVLKHWPGHGSVRQDTHDELGILDKTWAAIQSREMIPFKSGINAGAKMVIPGHIAVPKVDGLIPTTVSLKLISLLRQELGDDITIVADELGMMGVGKDPILVAPKMLAAGVNKILYVELPTRRNVDQKGVFRAAYEYLLRRK